MMNLVISNILIGLTEKGCGIGLKQIVTGLFLKIYLIIRMTIYPSEVLLGYYYMCEIKPSIFAKTNMVSL